MVTGKKSENMLGGVWLDVDRLLPDKHQPRQNFRDEDIEELGESIVNQHQKQAVIVSPAKDKPEFYYIKYGESRWRACKRKGVTKILCIIDQDDVYDGKLNVTRVLGQTVENVRRTGHTHAELIRVMSLILEEEEVVKSRGFVERSVTRFAKALGKSEAWASNYRTLANLHPDLIKLIDDKNSRLTFFMGVELARNEKTVQKMIFEEAVKRSSSNSSSSALHQSISSISRRHKIATGKPVRTRTSEKRNAYFSFFKKVDSLRNHLVGSLDGKEFTDFEKECLLSDSKDRIKPVLQQAEDLYKFLGERIEAIKSLNKRKK